MYVICKQSVCLTILARHDVCCILLPSGYNSIRREDAAMSMHLVLAPSIGLFERFQSKPVARLTARIGGYILSLATA